MPDRRSFRMTQPQLVKHTRSFLHPLQCLPIVPGIRLHHGDIPKNKRLLAAVLDAPQSRKRSACRTGLGKVVRGEGMIGLTRAILCAGSSRVLVSLWEVNDLATPALMKSFYTKLRAGQSVAEALREAKITMIHSDRPAQRHPHFWAPFVVSGAF